MRRVRFFTAPKIYGRVSNSPQTMHPGILAFLVEGTGPRSADSFGDDTISATITPASERWLLYATASAQN